MQIIDDLQELHGGQTADFSKYVPFSQKVCLIFHLVYHLHTHSNAKRALLNSRKKNIPDCGCGIFKIIILKLLLNKVSIS